MLKFREYIPTKVNTAIRAKTDFGVRYIEYNTFNRMWKYTDVTHPMGNVYCNTYDIQEWEYVDKHNMEQLFFKENPNLKKEREEFANQIIENTKPSKIELLILKFTNYIKQIKI